MSSLSIEKSKGRLAIILLVAATVLTIGYYIKLSYEAAKSAKDVVEIIHEKTKSKAETKVHDNCNKNMKLHEVYEIYAEDKWKVKRTLKFGITSQDNFVTKDGNPRPEYQVPPLQTKEDYKHLKVWYVILHRNVKGRVAAKEIEKNLVREYMKAYKKMPPEQKRPKID